MEFTSYEMIQMLKKHVDEDWIVDEMTDDELIDFYELVLNSKYEKHLDLREI